MRSPPPTCSTSTRWHVPLHPSSERLSILYHAAQAASPRNGPQQHSRLVPLPLVPPSYTRLPCVCQNGLHTTQPSSQLLFLHQNLHQRLLSLVSGTLHNQYCPTQYLFCLPQAPHVPWLQSKAGTWSPAMTHTHPMALPGALLLYPHSYPLLQQTSSHGQFQVIITLVGSTLSRSSLPVHHLIF